MSDEATQKQLLALLQELGSGQPEARAFRELMARDITELKMAVREINDHLKRINGTVAENAKSIAQLQLRAAERNNSCPHVTAIATSVQEVAEELREGIDANKQAIAERRAAANTWEEAWRILQPGAWVLIGFVLKLIAEHVGVWK